MSEAAAMTEAERRQCECGCGEPVPIAKKTRRDLGWVKGRPIRFVHGHSGGHVKGQAVVHGRRGGLPQAVFPGENYGRLTVVEQAESGRYPNGKTYLRWVCVCVCGTVVVVAAGHLRSGGTRSCGCLRRRDAEAGAA